MRRLQPAPSHRIGGGGLVEVGGKIWTGTKNDRPYQPTILKGPHSFFSILALIYMYYKQGCDPSWSSGSGLWGRGPCGLSCWENCLKSISMYPDGLNRLNWSLVLWNTKRTSLSNAVKRFGMEGRSKGSIFIWLFADIITTSLNSPRATRRVAS